jgi:predicted Zn-dependent peptidase
VPLSDTVFKKTKLGNGIRVLTEKHTNTRCTVAGFWLDRGTRDEAPDIMGVSHLIEHLVFKGTKKLTALEISQCMEAVGGELNAFTSKEHTCFHATTLKEDFELSLDVLSQLFNEAVFNEGDFEKERNVVVQELLMAKDDIEDSVFEAYFEKAFGKHPLGWPILGNEKSLSTMACEQVKTWYKTNYKAGNLVISAVGNLEHEQVVAMVERYLGHLPAERVEFDRQPAKMGVWRESTKRKSEQVHIVLGFPTISYGDKDRFPAYLVNACLGGGMTSRLYQKIREEKGWAYSVFSMLNTFTDSGVLLIYAATDKKLYQKVVEAVIEEINNLKENKMELKELDFYRKQVRGQLLIASEDIENRMNSLAVNEMVFGEYRSVDSVISEIESVSLQDVSNYIDKWVDLNKMNIYLMGDTPTEKTKKWLEAL